MTDLIEKLEQLTGTKATQLGRYGENHDEKAWVISDPDAKGPDLINAKVVYGGPLGYNNFLDGENALRLAMAINEQPGVVILKHANPCGMATARDTGALVLDPAVGEKEHSALGRAFLRAWQGDVMSAFGSVIALTRQMTEEIAGLVNNNRHVDVLMAPGFEGAAINTIRDYDDKREAKGQGRRAIRLVQVEGIDTQMREWYVARNILGGWLIDRKTSRVSLADDLTDLFRPAQMMHCDNSGKDLMVGVVTERSPSPQLAGLYAFGISAAKGTKSNSIMIVREYDDGCYQVLGMGAGQPNRKDAAMLAGRKATENLQREYFRLQGRAMLQADEQLFTEGVPKKWEKAMAALRDLEGSAVCGSLPSQYRVAEQGYVKQELGSDRVMATSDAFFPFPDGLDELADTGVRNIVSPGGSNNDAAVIARANERSITLVHTGVRYFLH